MKIYVDHNENIHIIDLEIISFLTYVRQKINMYQLY